MNTTYIYLAGIVDIDGWGDITLSSVRSAVDSARAEDPAAPVTIVLNSPGGDVMEGLAIYNYLRRAKVDIEISGMAASIASVIALAGQHVAVYDNSSILIHHAWSYLGDGNAADARHAAERMESVDAMIATVYASRGLSEDTIAELMDGPDGQGTLIPASRALELGLVDEVLDPALAVAACLKHRKPHPSDTITPNQEQTMDPRNEDDPILTDPNAACGDKPDAADPETDPDDTPDTPDTPDKPDDSASDEVAALKAQVAALEKKLAEMQTKSVQSAKLAASVAKAHNAPAPASVDEIPKLIKTLGYAKTRAEYPELMKAYCDREIAKGSIR